MALIGKLNAVGQDKRLRPIGMLALRWATSLRFSTLTRFAGRRIVSAFAAAPAVILTGSTIEDALHDADLLYKALKFTVETMGLDTFCLIADLSLEAEACGCQVLFSRESLPTVVTHPLAKSEDLARLKVPDPQKDGRMPVFLKTINLVKKNYTMIKVAAVTGPFTLAGHLVGTEIYVDVRKKPEKLKSVLDFSLRVITSYARELVKAGADMILLAEPLASQISPTDYEVFSLAYTAEFIATLNKPCILHICGKSDHILERMCDSGAVAISVDDIDIGRAITLVPKQIVLVGNMSPSSLWMNSPETIKSQTSQLLDIVRDRKEFVIAPGCDLGPNTPLENILSFVQTAKEHVTY